MDPRTDYTKIWSEKEIILELNVLKYLEFISKTQISEGEKNWFSCSFCPKIKKSSTVIDQWLWSILFKRSCH